MTCSRVKEAVPLYYYGELPPEEEEHLEAHCAECATCRNEVEEYRALARALDHAEMEPSLSLLSECRDLLARHVSAYERPAAPLPWWRAAFQRLVPERADLRVPAGAVALLAIGWFSARLLPVANQSPTLTMSLVRSVEPEASGRVQIAVDDVHRRVVSGGVEDRNIRALLLAAAREESNPGLRVESVDVLKGMTSSAEIRAALLETVERDPNPGVRLKALEGLKRFAQDRAVRNGLTAVLMNDSSPTVRIEVINLLVANQDGATVGMLQNLVRRENDGYVRSRLQRALVGMNASVGTF